MELKKKELAKEIQSLVIDEIKEILELENKPKGFKIRISVPNDVPDELKRFIEEKINENSDWLLDVLNRMYKGEIEF